MQPLNNPKTSLLKIAAHSSCLGIFTQKVHHGSNRKGPLEEKNWQTHCIPQLIQNRRSPLCTTMSAAVYVRRKYSKYSTAHSGWWNATDHMLNCIYSLEELNAQQQLHLAPRHPVAPGDSKSSSARRNNTLCPRVLAATACYTFKPKKLYLGNNGALPALLASRFCNK